MALVFFHDPEAPVRCALDLAKAFRNGSDIQLRMGIHTGPVYRVADINTNRNVAGGGINIAQRVMDSGDAGHILVSSAEAEVLTEVSSWCAMLHDLGEVQVKHGKLIHLYNLYNEEVGNPSIPSKIVAHQSRPATAEAAFAKRVANQSRKLALGLVCAGVLCVLGILIFNERHRSAAAVPSSRPVHRQITFRGDAYDPALSPDGHSLAFVAKKFGIEDKLMTQALSGGPSVELAKGRLGQVKWSPDGSELVFHKEFKPSVLSRLGGVPRKFDTIGLLSCWSPDGSHLATTTNNRESEVGIWLINKATGEAKKLPAPSYDSLQDMDCSPKTGEILLAITLSGKSQMWTMKPDGTDQRMVHRDEKSIDAARWSPVDYSVYYFRADDDTESLVKLMLGQRSKDPVVLMSGLETSGSFTISSDGSQLAYTRAQGASNLWTADVPNRHTNTGPVLRPLTSGTQSYQFPIVSPDGNWLAFMVDIGGKFNLFKMPIEGGEPIQLTFFDSENPSQPAWSPDGKQIAFICDQGGTAKVWIADTSGGTVRQLDKTDASNTNGRLSWPTPSEIVYQQPGMQNYRRLNLQTQSEQPLLPKDVDGWLPFRAVFSPDRKNIAVSWTRDNQGVWLISLQDRSEKLLYPGVCFPFGWSPDGRYVYAGGLEKREIVEIDVRDATKTRKILDLPNFAKGTTLTPDGRRIIVGELEIHSDVWVMRNFDPEARLVRLQN